MKREDRMVSKERVEEYVKVLYIHSSAETEKTHENTLVTGYQVL
jgi:hypothetical protein